MMKNWFNVDKAGLGRQADQQGKGRLIGELVQNALDEVGVTTIAITLKEVAGRPLADLTVEDDSPEGFKDLSHAYTLFADSYKRSNPEQRGQFNFGEKLVLAICEHASISTTTGTVSFDPSEGRIEKPRQKRDRGSVFAGRIKLTREEQADVNAYLRSLIVPETVLVKFNGERLLSRKPIRTFEVSLETLVADSDGVMRSRIRKTQVGIYEAHLGETPSLYEMGLPIVETGDKWHINIEQKVPLNRDRDNVKPAFLQSVRIAVLNAAYDMLTPDDSTAGWVKLAGADQRCSDEAIKRLVRLRFGEKVASPDPSDTEAMKRFQSQGGVIVAGLSKGEWSNVKRAGAVLPAGQICPTPKPYSDDPNATSAEVIPQDQWTPGMANIAEYAHFLAKELMGNDIAVRIVRTRNNFIAAYGNRQLDLNLFHLGQQWFEQGATENVDELLIHEFGHEYSSDHLSSEYYKALCRLGARMKKRALELPAEFHRFNGACEANASQLR